MFMKQYFASIKHNENRRMRYFLFAYLVAGLVGLGIGLFFKTINGVIAAIMMTYCVAWKLTEFIRDKIKLSCPLCDEKELLENFTLQCKPTAYECEECKRVYIDGVLKDGNN